MEVAQINLPLAIRQNLHSRAGNEFQATAQGILRLRVRGFQAVEPYGCDGDGGNDGYSRPLGLYAQIFAPSSERSSPREAARKALRDFAKLKRKWRHISPIKEFWFVMNSLGSNIHLEGALSEIERKHGVKTRFVGSAELSDEALKLDRPRLEELMGFTVGTNHSSSTIAANDLDLLSSADPKFLHGLHLMAAIGHPLPAQLCESLLPAAVDWKSLWKWLDARNWSRRNGDYYTIDKDVVATCLKNTAAQKLACEAWVPVLKQHGSVDCLYLAIRPLVMLGRFKEAVRLISYAGTSLPDPAWNAAMFSMWETFNKPRLLRKMVASERLAFALAGANLLAVAGQEEAAFKAFKSAFECKGDWPRNVSRGLMTLNFGVCAHKAGETPRFIRLMRRYSHAGRRF